MGWRGAHMCTGSHRRGARRSRNMTARSDEGALVAEILTKGVKIWPQTGLKLNSGSDKRSIFCHALAHSTVIFCSFSCEIRIPLLLAHDPSGV